ncbi:MAG: hypothetical protein R3E39_31715 [Anaerolineae bacterium]
MSERPVRPQAEDHWERTVQETARHLVYPPTPDIASRLRGRRVGAPRRKWRVALAFLLACAVVTLTVPQVQAFVLEIIRIGAIRVFLVEPTATPTRSPVSTRPPLPTPVRFASVLDMPGETTFARAQAVMNNRIKLPTYPPDLGAPDRVFLLSQEVPLVTLIWMKPDDPPSVRLSLEVIENSIAGTKMYPADGQPQEVSVNEKRALWLPTLHELHYYGMGEEITRLVTTPVLVWQAADGSLTYRLEADIPLEEAITIAESQPSP